MIISKTKGKRILLVHDLCDHNTLDESALDKLSNVLGEHEIEVLTATTAFDAEMMIVADPMIQAILLDWDLQIKIQVRFRHGCVVCLKHL